MQRAKSHASVIQVGAELDGSNENTGKRQHVPSHKEIQPTPWDFINFLPWLCLEWQSPQVVAVTYAVQEEYVSVNIDQHQASKARSKTTKRKDTQKISEENLSVVISKSQSPLEDVLYVIATFDSKSHLVEIAVNDPYLNIHRKTMKAIGFCIPYHFFLTRLTLRWTRLDYIVIHEIVKLLPMSCLSDIILDDTRGRPNYEMLLSQKSPLKYLSLKRCRIDDDQCKKIAANIDIGSAGETLNVLELASNLITDVGVIAIAESLRRNRNLRQLNLSGNMITDKGAIPLLSHLTKFQIRLDELMEANKRKSIYLHNKLKVNKTCYRELRQVAVQIKKSNKIQKTENDKDTFQEDATFIDPFDARSTVVEEDLTYCTGNLVLCSLNLSYNNLSYLSVQKIHEVLKNQSEMRTINGLKRISFRGNLVPMDCELYSEINNYLLGSMTTDFQKIRANKKKTQQ